MHLSTGFTASLAGIGLGLALADQQDAFLSTLPPGFSSPSYAFLKDNLAVIPGEWERGSLGMYTTHILIEGTG
jgi:hypothetical protein